MVNFTKLTVNMQVEWTSKRIRSAFLDFFRRKGHIIVPSASLVPQDDPTLLFTNAGMNQFKDVFLGIKEAPAPRVANTQKCLRVSGKHNDLEEVGKDGYHHTFFEMLGNWSFGDYFKQEAIEWAWELITGVFKLPPERLYVTVYPGSNGVPRDNESFNIWKSFMPEKHVLWGTHKDNFWEMGDEGPCGPSTEIHIDLRPEEERKEVPGHELVNSGHPAVIELWNIVFIQYNRTRKGELVPLQTHFVDTGMGLERLCMVLQNTGETYLTDLLKPLIELTEELTGRSWDEGEKVRMALRVQADHARAVAFSIADGVIPSNTGRGYVIRRLIRRAVRYFYQFLNYRQPLLSRLVSILPDIYGESFPELTQQMQLIVSTVEREEENFLRVIDSGLKRFYIYLQTLPARQIPGELVFQLYDTYGFPPDLTQLIAREEGYEVDWKGFEQEMDKQRKRARQAQQIEYSDWNVVSEGTQVFTGYDNLEEETRILRYRKARHPQSGEEYYEIALERVPFYPEGGGQVGDTGWLIEPDGTRHTVHDTRKYHQLILVKTNTLPRATRVRAVVDKERRFEIMKHHSATHLLHAALRRILGTHVRQKGSYLDDKRLRFDFSHPKPLTEQEIMKIEELVNQKIQENIPLKEERDVPIEEAIKRGALAFFGEKYGDRVRVITFDPEFSQELCGGTHVPATGHIGMFKIIKESGVSAGVRRIEAVAGMSAVRYIQSMYLQVSEATSMLRTANLTSGIAKLQEQVKKWRKEYERLLNSLADQLVYRLVKEYGDSRVLICNLGNVPYELLRQVMFRLRKKGIFDTIVLASIEREGELMGQILVHTTGDPPAVKIANMLMEKFKQLKGGGSDRFATLVVSEKLDISRVLETIESFLKHSASTLQ